MRLYLLATLLDSSGFDSLEDGVKGVLVSSITLEEGTFAYFRLFGKNEIFITYKDRLDIEEDIMWFETLEDVKNYFDQYRSNNKENNNLKYSVTAKKACVEFLERSWKSGSGLSAASCAGAVGVTNQTLKHWRDQYSKGLYDNLDGVTQVSSKVKEAHSTAVKELMQLKEKMTKQHEQELVNIDMQISVIKTLEEKGFTITKVA